jgi:hypothetical protein
MATVAEMARGELLFLHIHAEVGVVKVAGSVQGLLLFLFHKTEVGLEGVAEMIQGLPLFQLLHLDVGFVQMIERVRGVLLFPLPHMELGLVEVAEMVLLLPFPHLRVVVGSVQLKMAFVWLIEVAEIAPRGFLSQLLHVEIGLVEAAEMVRLHPFLLLRLEIELAEVAMAFAWDR